MKTTLMIVLTMVLVTGMAFGMTAKEKAELQDTPIVNLRADYTETEPNDDCASANSPFVLGDTYLGSLTAGDSDWFQYTAGAGNCVLFELALPEGGLSVDTKMWLWADDCVTQLAYNDDYNGLYSGFEVGPLAPGTYYIEVTGYSSSSTGDYVLMTSAFECPEDPCENVVPAIEGLNSNPGAPTWYSFTATADGAVFLESCLVGQFVDTVVELYDACEGNFVAGNDDQGVANCPDYSLSSFLCVEVVEGQVLYILWRNYGSGSTPFEWALQVYEGGDCTVATEETSWGSIKSLYR